MLASGLAPVYLATAEAGDAEMAARIAAHRARRGPAWRTVEEPLDLAGALSGKPAAGRAFLVDCLTLWLANLMAASAGSRPSGPPDRRLPQLAGAVVLVSNEVGQGIVPRTPWRALSRPCRASPPEPGRGGRRRRLRDRRPRSTPQMTCK